MKSLLFKLFAIATTAFCVTSTSYASDLNSDINLKIEKVNGTQIIEHSGASIDLESMHALLMLDGHIRTSSPLISENGHSLIPLSLLSELGILTLNVSWDTFDSSILLEKSNKIILLFADSKNAIVNGADVELSVSPRIINGEFYLPLIFICENMNIPLDYDNDIMGFNIISIDQYATSHNVILNQDQALETLKHAINTSATKTYTNSKTQKDLEIFLNNVSYRSIPDSVGRFYQFELTFNNQASQLSDGFKSLAFVDSVTAQIYIGDDRFGLTENIGQYLVLRHESSAPLENNPTKIVPFSHINTVGSSSLVYVNFPEQLSSNSLLETHYNYIEKISGSGRVFLSHKNISNMTIDYIVRFENKFDTLSTLSIIEDTAIHTTEKYQDQVIRAHKSRLYENKLLGQGYDVVLNPNESHDIVISKISNEQFFTGIIDFSASSDISITVFAVPSYMNAQEIPSPVIPYDFSYIPKSFTASGEIDPEAIYYTTYSGLGEDYRLRAKGIINASEMVRSPEFGSGWNIAFETGGSINNINHRNGLTELVDIKLFMPRGQFGEIEKATWQGNVAGITYDMDYLYLNNPNLRRTNPNLMRNYGNLGNWGVEYSITTEIRNDTSTDKIFTVDLIPTHQTTWATVVNGNALSKNVNNKLYSNTFNRQTFNNYDQIDIVNGVRSDTLTSILVKAGEVKELTYTYVLGTDCESNVFHVWTSVDA